MSRWNKAPAPSTPRPDTARKITSSAASTASKPFARWMPPAASIMPMGRPVAEATPIVIEILRAHHALLASEKVDHSYPHCWRCHKPTIFRATEQWFIGMDRNDFRQHALEAIRQVHWMPDWGQERISNMIATRPDWCISRQRVWGVPIIVFYCDHCREPLTDRKILDGIVRLFAEHTADVWYQRTAAELLPPGVACAK